MGSRRLIGALTVAVFCLLGVEYNVPFSPWVVASGTWTDNFTRSDNSDLSANSPPDPPGTYTEIEATANCDAEIVSNQLTLSIDSNTDCDDVYTGAVADKGMGDIDSCVIVQWISHTGWDTARGPRLILRSQDPPLGLHYEFRCGSPDCQGGRWEVVNGESFDSAATADSSCDNELTAFTSGDWWGACVTGTTNTATRFRVWHMDSTSPPSDPEDASTWDAAECDETPSGGYNADDTGELVGVAAFTRAGQGDNGDEMVFDSLSAATPP